MIYIERKIIIKNNEAAIEEPIILYKGDMNIELQFIIENNPFKYKPGMDATYGQLIIKRPNSEPIFSEPAKMPSSKVLFAITGDMIDELEELGDYDFQIRLLNTDQTSRGTLPPVTAGITIKKPLCEEAAVNATYVNDRNAYVMRANNVSTFALTDSDALFDEDGSYNRTNWYGGDIITDTRLNKIEEALYEINDDIPTDYATEEFVQDIDRNTRDYIIDNYATMLYVNNGIYKAETYTDNAVDNAIQRLDINRYATQDFVTSSIDTNNRYIENVILDDYATEEYVDEAIRNVEGGNVDLTGYATEAYVDQVLGDIDSILGGI